MLYEIPFLGVGISFRQELSEVVDDPLTPVNFLELLTDHYIDMPPHKEQEARQLAARFPVVLHGVELSIGTACSVDERYLEKVQKVADWVGAKWISDHLCFTRVPTLNIGQLTPLSFNESVVDIVVQNIIKVTQTLKYPFLVENISYYFRVPPSTLMEAEFITRIVRGADCGMLLDLTNLQNNAINNNYDPYEFLDQMPLERVIQIHLAGGYYHRGILLDTHSHAVPQDVFDLLKYVLPKTKNLKGIIIERDQNFPSSQEISQELGQVQELLANCSLYNSFTLSKESAAN